MQIPEQDEKNEELNEQIDQLSYAISQKYNDWLRECIAGLAERFKYTEDKPRTRRREFERHVKKNCIVKSIQRPVLAKAEESDKFVWELWENNTLISTLKIKLTKNEENGD